MPPIDPQTEIDAEKEKAVAILDQKIIDAIKLQNATGAPEMPAVINDLMTQRTTIFVQHYIGSMHHPDMLKALAIMKAATTDMTNVAATMKKVADYVAKVAGLLSGGAKVVTGLKGIIG
ncbi:MAG: hypothetical protein Q8K93_11420 [Reyranella sp.]|uniref:hypothetical protein n=1 Tax=Reyranella sp. TaxID=1929291 RepID=UPI00272FC1A4|nr:hypothetical protein [Reyranella sp.]MDP1962796.1 hypothetical protein [Reyranella sp.]MDP2375795.1 hypothetical protein [Reyranella sp.]